MPDSREFDVRYLDDLVMPYDKVTKELSDASPRIVEGANVYVTIGGKLALAPGLNDAGLTSFTVTKRPDRLVSYETLENPPKIYLVASLFNAVTSQWECQYLRLDAAAPAWTSVGSLRDVQASTRPHEIFVARGLCYIKSFPGGDKYGSVIFDGSGATPTLSPWGIPGPTVAARVTPSSGWAASTSAVTVNFGWKYVYCWKSRTLQYSSRSPLETDPTQPSSNTGAFANKKPAITVQGNADTTNIPKIAIFRTTDGGGTFMFVEEINNTGAGPITYIDNHRVATTTDNPQLDSQLDSGNIAPSQTSNLPPPPVDQYHVTGTDPVMPSTPIAYFARRLWYAIGNRIYFSGQEEILNGVPEESWPNPNGIRGNYYIVQGQPRLLRSSVSVLYIVTSNEALAVRGQDRSNLQMNTIVSDIGAAAGHPRAISSFRDLAFFLSQDLQVYVLSGATTPGLISTALGNEIRSAINANTEVAFEVFSRDGNIWLLVAVIDKVTSANTKVWVYDLARNIWFTPWTKPISAMVFGRLRETDQNKHLIVLTWDTATSTGKLAVLDPDIQTNCGTAYAPSLTTNLFTVPAGNHINSLRSPAHHPMLSYLLTERTKFAADTDPTVSYRLDEFSGATTSVSPQAPPFTLQHSSHSVNWYPVQQVCRRVQLKISKPALNEKFEIQNIGFVFQSEAGA